MNTNQHNHTLIEFWHGCLIILLASAVIAGLGYLSHLRFGHGLFAYAGLLIGLTIGIVFCLYVLSRLRKISIASHTRAQDRANARLTFPRFLLGIIRYGFIVAMAGGLGILAWIGAEDYALERALEGTVELVLGWFVSISIGLTAFHILLQAFEGE